MPAGLASRFYWKGNAVNKNLIPMAILLALSLPWVGCNKSGKLSQPSTFKPPSGPMELKLKWPLGERIVQHFSLKQKMDISVPGQPDPIKQDVIIGQKYSLTVLNENTDGGHLVEMAFLGVRMSVATGGKTILDYDSNKKPGGDKADPMAGPAAAVFQKVIGAKVQYFLDASNEVEGIGGVDALSNRLATAAQDDTAASIKSMFSESSLRQVIRGKQIMPSNPVQPGDTWPIQMEITMGDVGTMVMDYVFTFQDWEKHGKRTCARLEFQGTIKSKPDQPPSASGISTSISDGNSSGVCWFDPELGITIDSTINQNMTIVVSSRRNAATIPDQTQIVMNQVIDIKSESVK